MLLTLSYNDAVYNFYQVNEIINHNIFIRKTLLLPHGEDGELIRAQVKSWTAHFDQDQDMFLVSISEVQATDSMTYDAITKDLDMQLQRESELENKGQLFLFRDITYRRLIIGSNSSYELLVNWEYGSVTWEPVSVMRRNEPI